MLVKASKPIPAQRLLRLGAASHNENPLFTRYKRFPRSVLWHSCALYSEGYLGSRGRENPSDFWR